MSTISAGTAAGTALVTSGDTTGQLVFQTNGTTTALTLGTDQSATFAGNVVVSGTMATASPFSITGNSTAGAEIRLPEDTDNGTNYVAVKAPNSLASNITLTLPATTGTNGQTIITDGSGTLSFADILPTQTNNSGKYLTTNGTSASWGAISIPSASERYSVMTAGTYALIASPSSLPTGTFYASNSNIGGGSTSITGSCPVWSTYYSCWFALGYSLGTTNSFSLYYSKDGVNWLTYITDMAGKVGTTNNSFYTTAGANYANIIVDESNGRLWTFYPAGDNLSIIGRYKNAAASLSSNWTNAGSIISLPNSARYYGARYVDTGSTGTSAIVLLCSNQDQSNRLYTCPPGGTSFTLRVSGSTSNADNQPTSFTIDSVSGRAAVMYEGRNACMYMTGGNAQTDWAYNGSVLGGGSGFSSLITVGVGGGYYVTGYASGDANLYYSASGAGTWTTITSPCGGSTIYRVMYVNGVWYATTNNGMYSTTQNPPTSGWTRLTLSPLNLETINVRTQA